MPRGYDWQTHGNHGHWDPSAVYALDRKHDRDVLCTREERRWDRRRKIWIALTPKELKKRRLREERSSARESVPWSDGDREAVGLAIGFLLLLCALPFILIGVLFVLGIKEEKKAQAAETARRAALKASAPRLAAYLFHTSWGSSVSETDRAAVLFLRAAEIVQLHQWDRRGRLPSVSISDVVAYINRLVEWTPAIHSVVLTRLGKRRALRVSTNGSRVRIRYGAYNQIPRGDGSTPKKAASLFSTYFTWRLGGFRFVRNPSIPDIVPLPPDPLDDGKSFTTEEAYQLAHTYTDVPSWTEVTRRDEVYVSDEPLWRLLRFREARIVHAHVARLLRRRRGKVVTVAELKAHLRRRGRLDLVLPRVPEVLDALRGVGLIRYNSASGTFSA